MISSPSVPDARPAIGRPVQDVNTPDAGVPNAGVTRVGALLTYVFKTDKSTNLDIAVLSLSVIKN